MARRAIPLARRHAEVASSITAGLVIQGSLVVSGPLGARILGPEDRGHLALLLIMPAILAHLATLGLPLAITFHIAAEPGHARPVLRSLGWLTVVPAMALGAANAAFVAVVYGGGERYLLVTGLIAAAFVPAWVAHQYGLALLQGLGRRGWFQTLRVLPSPLYCAALVPLFLADGQRLPEVMGAWVGMHVVGAALSLWAGLRGLPGEVAGAPSGAGLRRFGLRSMVGAISPIETFRIDQLLVGVLLSPAQLGIYVVALAFVNLPRFISASIGAVAYPRVAAARARERALVGGIARHHVVLTLLVVVPAVTLAVAFVPWVIRVFFGEEFANAGTTARILLAGSVLFAVDRVLGDCARGAGVGAIDTIAEVVSWVSLLAAAAVLVPLFDANGVAAALGVAGAVSLGLLTVLWLRSGMGAVAPASAPERALRTSDGR